MLSTVKCTLYSIVCHQEMFEPRTSKNSDGSYAMIHGCKESRNFLDLEDVWLISLLEV